VFSWAIVIFPSKQTMLYPPQLKVKILETVHPEYAEASRQYRRIELLSIGGHKLEKAVREFLPIRPGEEPEIYEARIKKFSYQNILGDAIRKQGSRMSNGVVAFSGVAESENAFWNGLRESTDGKGRTENSLIVKIFSEALKYRTVYLQADKPRSEFEPRSLAEEELMGLSPRILVRSALEVVNWSEDDDETLSWIKIRQIATSNPDPTQPTLTQATWTFLDRETIAKYQAFVELGRKGEIAHILDASGKKIGAGEDALVSLAEEPIAHGLGRIPVVRVHLPDELWLGDDVASKAYQHLVLTCHEFDLLTSAFFQRFYKRPTIADNDLSQSFTGGDKPAFAPYLIPELEKFEWSEPQGTILDKLAAAIERCEVQVRQIVALTGASAEPDALQQSGVSKELDYFMGAESLKAYGHIITDALQDTYQLIADMRGRSEPELSVAGLDSFETDNLGSLLEKLTAVSLLDMEALRSKLTPSLFMLVQEKLMTNLLGNMTPLDKQAILDELAAGRSSPTNP
jgi:hypothetical protein